MVKGRGTHSVCIPFNQYLVSDDGDDDDDVVVDDDDDDDDDLCMSMLNAWLTIFPLTIYYFFYYYYYFYH